MASLTDEDISFAELAAVIEKDTVLAGSVLRAVNSAFYARRGTVNSVKHAVAVLGIGKLRNLSMSMSLARMWNATGLPSGWSSRSFNQHAVASAILADLLAVELDTEYAEGAFTAGLLQNVGLVLIALGLPTQYDSVLKAYQTGTGCLSDYEEGYIGVTHAELSGEILSRWHLPEPIAEAVARHHGPHASDKPRPLSRVLELAGTMTEQQGILPQPWMRKPDGAPAHVLASLGLEGRAEAVLENFKGEYDTIKPFFG
jgi:HD-like signal output (HDOD) protein